MRGNHSQDSKEFSFTIRTLALLGLASLAACEQVCSELQSAGPPIIRIEESIDYHGREAGIREGELRQIVAEVLESEGFRLAKAGEQANVTIGVEVTALQSGFAQYAGLVQVSLREPVTVWIGNVDANATTTSNSFVFTAPRRSVREFVRGNLRDAVRTVVRRHGRLRPVAGSES